jgi:hypothetical protein
MESVETRRNAKLIEVTKKADELQFQCEHSTRVTNERLTLALEAIEELRRLQDEFLDAFDVQISPSIDTAINRVTTLLDKIG